MTLQWAENQSVGVERIDRQHQMYYDLMSNLSAAIDEGASMERCLRLLDEFKHFLQFHFKAEENLMIDTNYSEYSTEYNEHKHCIEMIKTITWQYQENEISASDALAEICDWLVLHISNHDIKFGNHLKSLHASAVS